MQSNITAKMVFFIINLFQSCLNNAFFSLNSGVFACDLVWYELMHIETDVVKCGHGSFWTLNEPFHSY